MLLSCNSVPRTLGEEDSLESKDFTKVKERQLVL